MSNNHTQTTRLVTMFKALANPHRLELFNRLATCCVPGTVCALADALMTVGELGDGLEIAPSTLSHHLKTLHAAGLISMRRRGRRVECWVEPSTLRELSTFFTSPFAAPSACCTPQNRNA